MKILYNGKDIYDDISLGYAVHEMHSEKEADSLTLRFNDSKGLWSKWAPQCGDTIELEDKKSRTGKMVIFDMTAKNGIYTVRAMSMPVSLNARRTASWQKVRLSQLASEIAGRHGLAISTYDIKDQTYEAMIQEDESDAAFLSRLCMLEGCGLLIYDGRIVIYNEETMEKKTAAFDVTVGAGGEYAYSEGSANQYGAVRVTGGSFTGEYRAGTSLMTYEAAVRVNNEVEAARFARNILKSLNKKKKTGRLRKELDGKYLAAETFRLNTGKAIGWNGKCFITDVRNDYVRNTSDIYFRMLEEEE